MLIISTVFTDVTIRFHLMKDRNVFYEEIFDVYAEFCVCFVRWCLCLKSVFLCVRFIRVLNTFYNRYVILKI